MTTDRGGRAKFWREFVCLSKYARGEKLDSGTNQVQAQNDCLYPIDIEGLIWWRRRESNLTRVSEQA
jgi:hypothetical protein